MSDVLALSAREELAILKEVDALRDAHPTLEALCRALGDYLRDLLGARAVGFAVVADGDLVAVGELSAALQAVAGTLPLDDDWECVDRGHVHAYALNPSGRLLGVALIDIDGGLDPANRSRAAAFTLQADSALAQALAFRDLADRNSELEAVYAIDHIRDEGLEFEEMIERVMAHVLRVIPAQTAVVGLSTATDPEQRVHLRQPTGAAPLDAATVHAIEDFIGDAFQARMLIRRDHVGAFAGGLCVPLILNEHIIGGFTVLGADFGPRDERMLSAICSQADTAIFEDLSRQRIKGVFKRYVADHVVDEMLRQEGTDFLKGVRREVSILFSDLRSFTTVSESLPVDQLVGMLNEHLAEMTEIVFEHGGTVDKFIGDCVMAFWNAPIANPDHAAQCVRAAVAMRAAHNRLRARWVARGLPDPKIGVGINTGEVMVGNIGSERLSSYTVIGDHVNLAARMEGLSAGDDVLITAHTYACLGDRVQVEPRGEEIVKGKTVPVMTYNVTAID